MSSFVKSAQRKKKALLRVKLVREFNGLAVVHQAYWSPAHLFDK